jgi:thiosulfate/3-mercaptopyruvate sulfurtransferase
MSSITPATAASARALVFTSPAALEAALSAPSPPSVLDATWYLHTLGKDARGEYNVRRIPTARFFDLDAVSDKTSTLPHMLPQASNFAAAMRTLDIVRSRPVIIYDATGISSAAARVAWTLRAFGHKSATVLDGGLPRWLAEGRSVETTPPPAPVVNKLIPAAAAASSSNESCDGWTLSSAYVRDMAAVRALTLEAMQGGSQEERRVRALVVDARPPLRFSGEVPEPRPIPSGHMPGARSVPSGTLVDATGALLPTDALRAAFHKGGIDVDRKGPLVLSCGSGVMACTLWLALRACGRPEGLDSVYDGSWTEWASVDANHLSQGFIRNGPADEKSSDFSL